MPDIATILGAVTSVTGNLLSATEIGKNLKEVFGGPKVDITASKQLVLELVNHMLDAQIAQMQIREALLTLQQDLKERNRFEEDAARYELVQSGRGAAFYALKPNDPLGEPPHNICPNCLAKRVKSFLQPKPAGGNFLTCGPCNQDFAVPDRGESAGIQFGPVRKSSRFDGVDNF